MPRQKKLPDQQAGKEGKPMAATEKEFTFINLHDKEGNTYKLEFNARVVKNMERKGFKIDTDYPLTMIDDLFLGAFQMHHKGIMPEKAKAIWKCQNKKDELLAALIKLYMKPLEDIMGDEAENDENADPTWETV